MPRISLKRLVALCFACLLCCASALAAELIGPSGLRSALIAGEPSSGKTSLLRDLARREG